MKVLVAYASKYGSTRRIAEFIGEKLRSTGMTADVKEVGAASNIGEYGAFVIGSAVFMGKWMKEATEFVTRNGATLASRPVFLFSSGPLGTQPKDRKGQDVREGAVYAKDVEQLKSVSHARDHRVFFGTLDPDRLSLAHKLVRMIPAAHDVMPKGDFRDWKEIEAWARGIEVALGAQVTT